MHCKLDPFGSIEVLKLLKPGFELSGKQFLMSTYGAVLTITEPLGERKLTLPSVNGIKWVANQHKRMSTEEREILTRICEIENLTKLGHDTMFEIDSSDLTFLDNSYPALMGVIDSLYQTESIANLSNLLEALYVLDLVGKEDTEELQHTISEDFHQEALLNRFLPDPAITVEVVRSIQPLNDEAVKQNLLQVFRNVLRLPPTETGSGRDNWYQTSSGSEESRRDQVAENELIHSEVGSFLAQQPLESLIRPRRPTLGLGGSILPDRETLGMTEQLDACYRRFIISTLHDSVDTQSGLFFPVSSSRYQRYISRAVENFDGDESQSQIDFFEVRAEGIVPGSVEGKVQMLPAELTQPEIEVLSGSKYTPERSIELPSTGFGPLTITASYSFFSGSLDSPKTSIPELARMIPEDLRHLLKPWTHISSYPKVAQDFIAELRKSDSVVTVLKQVLKFIREHYGYDSQVIESKAYQEFVLSLTTPVENLRNAIERRLDVVHGFAEQKDGRTCLGKGVCAEFAIITREYLAHIGIPALSASGLRLNAKEITENHRHASAIMFLPDRNGHLTLITADPLFEDNTVNEIETTADRKMRNAHHANSPANTRAEGDLTPKPADFFRELIVSLGLETDDTGAMHKIADLVEEVRQSRGGVEIQNPYSTPDARLGNAWSLLLDQNLRNAYKKRNARRKDKTSGLSKRVFDSAQSHSIPER